MQGVDSGGDTRHQAPVAHVRVLLGAPRATACAIADDGAIIGRSGAVADGKALVELDDARVSRRHAQIQYGAGGWELIDQESRNGGYVDGFKIGSGARVPLRDGAVLRFGGSLLVFRTGAPMDDGNDDFAVFPGTAPAVVLVRRRLSALVPSQGHVLVHGETGTGKELVAQSFAKRGPFVPLNCAQLKRELAGSELFGHTKGSFTGAAPRQGLVERATGGVLFLDEIGELALDVQADLLRFLEDGYYRVVGSNELHHSDARVVAATNVDLDLAVARGQFRRDLLARLRSRHTPLELPPLRARREDIPRWATMFLREAGGDASAPWDAGFLECLLLYAWPANLRELSGVVGTLAVEAGPAPYAARTLPRYIREHRSTLRDPLLEPAQLAIEPPPVAAAKREVARARKPTKSEYEVALAETNGSVRRTASILGVVRRQVYRDAIRFGVDIATYRAQGVEAESEDNL